MPDTCIPEIDGLPNRVRKYREALHINRYQLSVRADVDPKIISLIEKGKACNPTLKTALRIAEALGITLEQLLGRENVVQKPQNLGRETWR